MKSEMLHTVVLLRIRGEECVVGVQKNEDKAVSVVLTKWSDIDDVGEVYVDNTYLKKGEIRLNDILYRLSSCPSS